MRPWNLRRVTDWTLRLVAAAILFQTLFFKFTGAPESVYIFSTLHMEPWGRFGSGVAELVAGVLLLLPATVILGAMLSAAVIGGAILGHLTVLGIEVEGDGGLLFGLAVVVFLASLAIAWLRRAEIPFVGERLAPRRPHRRHGASSIAAQTSCRHPVARQGGAGKRVLILGGGFGGVYTALELERALLWDDEVEVMLVNREKFFLFTPMLHEVAASDLDLTNIVSPIRKMLRRVDFFEGEAVDVDLTARRVTLRHGSDRHTHAVQYDVLVLGLGSITNFFDLPGLTEGALTMKSLGDAMRLRNRMIGFLEEADTECAAAIREPLLTFVVAGGGFSGVETTAGVNDFLRAALPLYPHLKIDDLRVVLVHPGEVILPELGPELGSYAQRKLAERGVEIRTRTKVLGMAEDRVRLSDGSQLRSRSLVWTAGTAPHPILTDLPLAKERGRILVDEHLQVDGFPGVYALGDCAAVPEATSPGAFCPPTAQHALRQARVVARNVLSTLSGDPVGARFGFKTLGQLAAIGRRTGVARILGINFSGFVAWWLWRTIYLAKLPRIEKKVRVLLDWTLDLVFSKDLVQFLGSPGDRASSGGLADAASPLAATSEPTEAADSQPVRAAP
jgi:NADH dehydrogenase